MEAHVVAIVQSLHFIAHVLEEQTVLVWIDFQSAFQLPQEEFHAAHWDDAFLLAIDEIPDLREAKVPFTILTKQQTC